AHIDDAGKSKAGGNGCGGDAVLAGTGFGGLNKDNVAEELFITKAPGIDVSSGVETAPGVKSVAKIDEFFDAVEKAN
ncbi:N-(5'-phosphoribosyl)anthranilate isomerase, partial [Rhizobium ruizarguesonis]